MTPITRGDYQRVIYTSPSESTRDAARSLITNCDRVIVSGRDTVVAPEMLSHFSFTTYQQLIEGAAK
jgi:hypothetical protein